MSQLRPRQPFGRLAAVTAQDQPRARAGTPDALPVLGKAPLPVGDEASEAESEEEESEEESARERSEASSAEEEDWRPISAAEPNADYGGRGLLSRCSDELGVRFWLLRIYLRRLSRDPLGLTQFIAGVAFILWCIVASVLLIVVRVTYEGGAADEARRRLVGSCAQRVAAEVAPIFGGALAVYDAVHYAVQRKRFFEPQDYGAVTGVLAPLFAAHGALRAVDLAFVGRDFSFTARRLWRSNDTSANFSDPLLVLQSNASDCFARLGERGCLSAVPGRDQSWYNLAASLPGGQESESLGRATYVMPKLSRLGSSFRWLDGPRIVQRSRETGTLAGGGVSDSGKPFQASLTWEPAYSLVFRSVFPGTSGSLSVVGRSVLRLDGLAEGSRLSAPELLGAAGGICIIDRFGTLMGTAMTGDLLFVQAGRGRPRFRQLWELDAVWARGMQGQSLGAGGLELLELEGFVVAVAPLPGRGMDQFRVVVAAELEPFVDASLRSLLGRGTAAVIVPYPAAFAVFLLWWGYQQYKLRKALARVHPHSEGVDDSDLAPKYISGMSALNAAAEEQGTRKARGMWTGGNVEVSMIHKPGKTVF